MKLVKPKTDFTLTQEADIYQTYIIASLPWVGVNDDDFVPAYFINYVFSAPAFSSRLMGELRIKRGLVYDVSSHFEHPAFFVTTRTANDKASHVILAIKEQLSRTAEKGPSQE